MIALKKGLAYSLFLIVVVELSARIMSFSLGYGFRTDNQRFISPFFTGTDMPYPILKDETGIFVNGHEIPYKKDKNEALKFLPKLNSELMKIAKTGIIKKKNASRNISRITKKINNL